jgi:hypothetical protein
MQALKNLLRLCAAHFKATAAACAAAACIAAYVCSPGHGHEDRDHDRDDRRPACEDEAAEHAKWSCNDAKGQKYYSKRPAQCAQYYPSCVANGKVPHECKDPDFERAKMCAPTATATSTATKTQTATNTSVNTSTATSTSVYTFPTAPGRVCTVDSFTQSGGTTQYVKKIDVLFVMDHSGSMKRHWDEIAANIENMVKQLPATTDIRYGVMLADVGAWSGKLYNPLGTAYLDNQKMSVAQISAALQKTFAAAMKVSDAGSGEAALYSLTQAVTVRAAANQRAGFFRADAGLSVIFMSDENDIGVMAPHAAGIPVKCDASFEAGIKKTYYDSKGITVASTIGALKALKGELPVKANAFVNITKADLFTDNSAGAHCLYDMIGYGYIDAASASQGLLYSIQQSKAAGLTQLGQLIAQSLALQHDFPLSQPASKVDPATVLAAVDGAAAPGIYSAATDSEHLENGGRFGSQIQVRYCAPVANQGVAWTLTGFTGTPSQTSVGLGWQTTQYATSGKILWGTSAAALTNEVNDSNVATNHAVTVSGLIPNTVYYFQAVSSDTFGQTQSSAVLSFRTLPQWTISEVSAQAARTSASVQWNTAEYPTTGYVLWGSAANGLTNQSAVTATANAHSMALGGLSPSTTYYYQVVASDDLGKSESSAVQSFTTQADWGITGFAGTPSLTSVALTWNTPNQATTGVVFYGTSAGSLGSQVSDSANGTAHSANVGGLNPDTDYYFQAVASVSGSASKSSAVILVHTAAANWQITGFGGSSTQTSVTVSWTTPGFATSGSVAWGNSSTALPNTVIDTANGEAHSATLSGLTAGTVYYFEATSVDAYGGQRSSAVVAISTAAIPLPTWSITGFAGTSTTSSVTLTWNTSQYATSGAVIYGDSATTLGGQTNDSVTGTSHSVTISGLSANTVYYFQALGADDRGQNQKSDVIQVATMANVVVTPPANWVITGFDGTSTGNTVNLIWTTPGAPTTATVKVGTSASDLTLRTVTVNTASETQQLAVTGLNLSTQYFFQVIATDSAGKSQESVIISKTTKAQ